MATDKHSYSRKFTDAEVAEIRDRYVAGATLRELGQQYRCSHATVLSVLRKYDLTCIRSYENRDEQHSFSLTLTDDEVEEIYLRYVAGATLKDLGQRYHCDPTTVWAALKKYDPTCIRAASPVKGKLYSVKRERIYKRLPNKTLFTMYKRRMDGERVCDLMEEYHLTRNAFRHAMQAVEKVARHYGYLRSET